MASPVAGHTFVRTTSHRARARLKAVAGETKEFFSWDREGSWSLVPNDKLNRVLEIKGVSRASKIGDLNPCISFGGKR